MVLGTFFNMDNFEYFMGKGPSLTFLCVNLNRKHQDNNSFKAIYILLNYSTIYHLYVTMDFVKVTFTRVSKFTFFDTIRKNNLILHKEIEQEYKYGFWLNL